MARMFPPEFDETSPSAAEKHVFNLLKTDVHTGNWLVLHSLGLSRRPSGPYGEIDFVVIVPGEGLVCLEVKGGRVSCEGGIWKTTNRLGSTSALKKSPMMQAREAMFALRDRIKKNFGDLAAESLCPIGCGVVFPDVISPPATPEFDRTDVIDVQDLNKPISEAVLRIVRLRLRPLQPRGRAAVPTDTEAKSLLNFLRPDFELIVARGIRVGRSEERLLRLTEEQYSRLDELQDNSRCLFVGAAGTGKTLLALEHARRKKREGSNVTLICFNRMLGSRLEEQTRGAAIRCGTYHSLVRKAILESSFAAEFTQKEKEAFESGDAHRLFDEIYSLYGQLAFDETGNQCDVLVVDEVQDLFRPSTFDVLNRILAGGLAEGSWAMFGDFTRQALYGTSGNPLTVLERYCRHFTRARLTLNCRNTRRIAEETSLLSGFDRPPYRMNQETGLAVDHRYWKKAADLVGTLEKVVLRLIAEGIAPNDVVILSPRRLDSSSLGGVTEIGGLALRDASADQRIGDKAIAFSTIHAFKGLESAVVIVIDIEQVDSEEMRSLLYVGMSRARSLLVLMIKEAARAFLEQRIREAIIHGLQS
jgi:hypothetical protein